MRYVYRALITRRGCDADHLAQTHPQPGPNYGENYSLQPISWKTILRVVLLGWHCVVLLQVTVRTL